MTQNVFDPARHAIVAVDPDTKDHFHVSFSELKSDLGLPDQPVAISADVPPPAAAPALDWSEVEAKVREMIPPPAADFRPDVEMQLEAIRGDVSNALSAVLERLKQIEAVVSDHSENFDMIKSKGGAGL